MNDRMDIVKQAPEEAPERQPQQQMPSPQFPSPDMAPLTASAWAKVQARYVMAQARPRIWAQVRHELMQECRNFRFANAAIWELKIGGKMTRDFSVRFAEAAARAMRNVYVEVQRGQENDAERTYVVSVTDLESNSGVSQEVVVDKFMLRKKPPEGLPAIVHTRNQYGEPLYRVVATEQDLLARSGAIISKARRQLVISQLPTWLVDDCKVELQRTRKAGGTRIAGQMPRDVLDTFADLGVDAMKLQRFLGHDIETTQPAELELLRNLALALREQELTWAQVMEARHGGEVAPGGPERATHQEEATPSSSHAPPPTPPPPATTEAVSESPPPGPAPSADLEASPSASSEDGGSPPQAQGPPPERSRADGLVDALRKRRRAGPGRG